MLIKESAPGKLILIGEYAVLEGAPALVGALDRQALIKLSSSGSELYSVSAPAIEVYNAKFSISDNNLINFQGPGIQKSLRRLSFFRSTFEYAWQYCKRSCMLPDTPFHTEIDTSAFYSEELKTKLGFGSSAALTVALVKALFKLSGRDLSDPINQNRLFRLSLAAHRKAQGDLGSGIDIAASSFGGILEYKVGLNKKAEQILPRQMDIWNELPMLTVFTGSSESTRKMVSGVGELKKSQPRLYKELIDHLSVISERGCVAYNNKDSDAFLGAITDYYHQLDLLGTKSSMPIISEVHRNIALIVQKNGGIYKPSGAGSGDIGIAFANSPEKLSSISQVINENNFRTIDCKIVHLNFLN